MRRCTFECSGLHCGRPFGDDTGEHDTWYCTHSDALDEPLPPECHDSPSGMVLGGFEYGQVCPLTHPTGRLFA